MKIQFQLFKTKKSKSYAWFFLVSIYLFLISFGFGPYITDDHPFRQTQTALSARFIDGFSNIFDYETPLFGPPWSFPLEFPFYQYLAKILSETNLFSLELSGRLISVMFFLMCIYPMHYLLEQLQIKEKIVVISIIILTPLYVFWSRSFMIETTALFFSLAYFKSFVQLTSSSSINIWHYFCLLILGSMAALVKITTFTPIFLIASILWLINAYQHYKEAECRKKLFVIALIQTSIFCLALAWIKHSDAIKLLNPLSSILTSDNLRTWNFGTFDQRFDPYIWFRLINNTTDIYFPYPRTLMWVKITFISFLTFVYLFCWKNSTNKRRLQSISLVALFLFPFLIFTNLHRIHNYYQCANAIFLSAAIGVIFIGALEKTQGGLHKSIIALYVLVIISFAGNSIWYFSFKSTFSNKYQEIAEFINNNTSTNGVILITGQDYSSEIPYYSKRKAIMLPDSFPDQNAELALDKALEEKILIAAFVSCGNPKKNYLVKKLFFISNTPDFISQDCNVNLTPGVIPIL